MAPFVGRFFGKDAYRGRTAAGADLFDWARLNDAIAEHRLAPPRLRLEQAGGDVSKGLFTSRTTRRGAVLQDLDPAVLNARLRDGATLILDAAHELSPPLRRLCEALAAEFVCAVQANLYACWGVTQGFDVHWDDHDVFVVQIAGGKRWALYGSTRPWPSRRDDHAAHPRPERPIEEIVLEPGDLLYLPRGYWHAAVGLGEPTMHLTIGLTRKTGGDFLRWLADHCLSEAAVRADLPLEQDDAALGARVADLLAQLAARPADELARLYRRHVEAGQAYRPQLAFPFIGAEPQRPGPTARLRLAPGVARLEPGSDATCVVLSWRGTEFTVAAALAGPLRRLVAGEAVPVQAFDAAVGRPAHVQAFLAGMLSRGVFLLDGQGS